MMHSWESTLACGDAQLGELACEKWLLGMHS